MEEMMAEPWQSGVQSALNDLLCSGDLPGLAIAVARGDRAPSHLLIGSDAAGRPIATDTLSPVASITKLATALAVLRLADVGELGLDDPLSRHLPEAAAARAGINLRNL